MNPKYNSIIHKQLTIYFKVKYGYIFTGYYKLYGVVIRVI